MSDMPWWFWLAIGCAIGPIYGSVMTAHLHRRHRRAVDGR